MFTVKEAAEYLGVSHITLNRWRCTGESPIFAKMGGAVRYQKSDLDDYIASRKVSSTSQKIGGAA